ncbi:MAG: SMP-30/gluconolactonase/LRE family protein [Alphaproteobacteria bacterium]
MTELTVLLDNLTFPEGPRWRDGRLWFSDFYAHEVIAVDMAGARETIVTVPHQPSGLGWTPDGALLIVSMINQSLLRLDDGALTTVADLSSLAGYHCNDMVVDSQGRAYVGNFGYNTYAGGEARGANLIRVDPDGSIHRAERDLLFPNGSVITPDDKTLIIGETHGQRLTAWDKAADGSLSNRRVWADLGDGYPDGICLDADGAIWVAGPRNKETIRVLEGGAVTHRISTGEHGSYACMLGGEDRKTLFICTCAASGPDMAAKRTGRIEYTEVDVPGAGLP